MKEEEMQQIQRFISGWSATYQQQGCIGKVFFVVFSILFVCVCCSIPLAVLSPAIPTLETASTPIDISSLQTSAVETAFAVITQTAIANAPTLTFTPHLEPTFTATYAETSTLEPIATLSALDVSCIPSTTKREEGVVLGIVDGDTIDVVINGQTFRVRYIGIDTPERYDAFYAQATQANRELVDNKTVLLINDVSETDRYGRILRYVIAGNTFVNYELVRRGYALAYTYPPDVACSDFFVSAQHQAQSSNTGLWASISISLTAVNNNNSGSSGGNCDPSYPTVCIPPPPPDLDCKDIPYRRFQVLPPDHHRFDQDNNGIGCES